jgi:hypothetical protein
VFQRQALDLVVVDQAGSSTPYCTALNSLPGIDLGAVGEVPAMRQRHAEDGVARLQQGQVHGLVGLRARMRLHVGVVGAEQLLAAVDGQLLGHVHVLAAAVVALARIALGVLVGQHWLPCASSTRGLA